MMPKFNTKTAAVITVKALIIAATFGWFTFAAATPNVFDWPVYLRFLFVPCVIAAIIATTKK